MTSLAWENGERVPSVEPVFPQDEVTPEELQDGKRELYREALILQREQGFAAGEQAALGAVLDQLLSGRITPGAIVTRVAALAVRQKKMTPEVALRLTGGSERALRKAAAKSESSAVLHC